MVGGPWQRRLATEAPLADAIVVLSGGRHSAPGAARVSEWEDPDRFLAGLDLYRAGKAPRLLFTGGASPFRPGQPPEGQRYLEEAAQLGIPPVAMASTPPVVNTAEEAIAIRRLLGRQTSTTTASPPRILLVTSAFHMRRAQRLFERQGLQVRPFPVDFQTRGRWAGPSGATPASGCRRRRHWIPVPVPCASCWAGWCIAPGDPCLTSVNQPRRRCLPVRSATWSPVVLAFSVLTSSIA